VFVGRQLCGCCGSNKRRPGHCCCGGAEWDSVPDEQKQAEYPRSAVNRTKTCTGVIWVIGIASLILMAMGASRLQTAYDSFWGGLLGPASPNLIEYTTSKIQETDTKSRRADGTYISGMTNATFTNALQGVTDLQGDVSTSKESADGYVVTITKISYAVGIGPMVFLIAAVAMAVFDIRKCGPACLTCFFFLLIIVYTILAIVLSASGLVMRDACDEIKLHFKRQPGLFQWYLVPLCTKTLDFGSIQADIQQSEYDAAVEGCTDMLSICDSSSVYNPASPDIVFQCGITNATAQCDGALKFETIFNATTEKSGTSACSPAGTPSNPCDMRRCATDCINANTRSKAASALLSLSDANQAVSVFTGPVSDLFNCNVVIDKSFLAFSKCDALAEGMLLIGSGATIYAFAFAVGICVMFKGQKHFFKPPPEVDDEKEANREPTAPEKEGEEYETSKV